MENNFTEDNILVEQVKNGNEFAMDSLMPKYKTLVSSIARRYYLIGGDQDDLIQEGMIGLYKACINYNPKKHSSFKTFAYICIQRQIQTAIKIDNRQKNLILNNALSFDINSNEVIIANSNQLHQQSFMYLPIESKTPENQMIEIEEYNEKINTIKNALSKYEFNVFKLYLDGYKAEKISQIMKKDYKSIDNALVRLKNKLDFLKNK